MKVELNLDEKQVKDLEGDLKDLIKNLTSDQKVDILSQCLNNCIGDLIYKPDNSYYSNKQMTDFGKELLSSLTQSITKSVVSKVTRNKDTKEIMNRTIEYTTENLEMIVRNAIMEFVIDNLFPNKNMLLQTMNRICDDNINSRFNNH